MAAPATVTEARIMVQQLRVDYAAEAVVGPIDFSVTAGTCAGLIGANGAGKTTLLRAICGLLRPSAGEVVVNGRAVTYGQVPAGLSGMIEEPRLYPWLDAEDNLRAVCLFRPDRIEAIDSVLSRVGLERGTGRIVSKYSQGMRQRLGIARVLLADARTLLLDEPTNGLDPVGIRWFRDLVGELVDEGRTVVLSSHLLHEVQQMAQTYCMLSNGRVVVSGQTGDLKGMNSLEDLYFSTVRA